MALNCPKLALQIAICIITALQSRKLRDRFFDSEVFGIDIYAYTIYTHIIIIYVRMSFNFLEDGQSCFDMVNAQQRGNNQFNRQVQVIVPRSSFLAMAD